MTQSTIVRARGRYLTLPVRTGAPKTMVRLYRRDEVVRAFEAELDPERPDFRVFSDLSSFEGQELRIELDGEGVGPGHVEALLVTDELPEAEEPYREARRPQFHFSSRRGWNSDPNGLLWYDGEYHLFYQHNPYGWNWGQMHWGHAVSHDLVHWSELPDALEPDRMGAMFSGSGVVDRENAAGFQRGGEAPLILVYTAAGGRAPGSAGKPFTQCIAYSTDRGRTFRKHDGNPALGHIIGANRDPKVIRHESSRRWVMALYLEGNSYGLFVSPDLLNWEQSDTIGIPGDRECPDLFELPVDGQRANTRWVLWGAGGRYLLGAFDGRVFLPEGGVQTLGAGGDSYAAQTWCDVPARDGRRIQIAWLRAEMKGMPWNQQMTFPCELTLRSTPEGIRLHSYPVREIEGLRGKRHEWKHLDLEGGERRLSGTEGTLLDIDASFVLRSAREVGLRVRGLEVRYDAGRRQLFCQHRAAELPPGGAGLDLRILVDRSSIEVFANGGRAALHIAAVADGAEKDVVVYSRGGPAGIAALTVFELASSWR